MTEVRKSHDQAAPSAALRQTVRLSECAECGRPFPEPISEEQARADWGDAADDEIAYCCSGCADDFDGTSANVR